MTEALLASFLFTARSLSFYAAARKLEISPQAVSKNIRRLENDLGVTLFDRKQKTLRLTPEGEAYMAHVIRTDQQFYRTLIRAQQLPDPEAPRLTISYAPEFNLMPTFRHLVRGFSGAVLSARCYPVRDTLQALTDGELDAAILPRSCLPASLTSLPFLSSPVLLAGLPDLVPAGETDPAAILRGRLLFLVEEALTQDRREPDIPGFCRRYPALDIDSRSIRVLPSMERVETALLLGQGFTITDLINRIGASRDFCFFPLEDALELDLVFRQADIRRPALFELLSSLRGHADTILQEARAMGH